MDDAKTTQLVLAHAKEIAEARKAYPRVSEEIEVFRKDVRRIVKELFLEIQDIDKENDRELVTVLAINGIHKMTDEIFL